MADSRPNNTIAKPPLRRLSSNGAMSDQPLLDHPDVALANATAPAPAWECIPFDVPCPLCGKPVNGQSEPCCASCGARFDWAEAAPVQQMRCATCGYQLFGLPEQRCPECGTEFIWDLVLAEVIAAARVRRVDLLEHQWPRNPIQSLLRSLRMAAFRPRKLWSEYYVAFRPRVIPLLLLMVVQWLLFAYGWDASAALVDPLMNAIGRWTGSNLRFVYPLRVHGSLLTHLAIWYIATFAALQLLFQTKPRLGVHWTDTLRVLVHATALASLCTAAWCFLEAMLDSTLFFTPTIAGRGAVSYIVLRNAVLLTALVSTWAYLWIGLRRHLRVPHAWGVSAACLLLGHLIALAFQR